jgi:predicted AAA+ superfamily ATPase
LIENDHLRDYRTLHEHILKYFKGVDGKKFIFLDEVQEVHEWERSVESLFTLEQYDIYITGSNAHLLSSELASKLSGRYVEIPVYSLSFGEYLQFMELEHDQLEKHFGLFLKFGGFPALPHFDDDVDVVYQYISSLYNTILLKDIVKRYNLRNISLLENITCYAFQNIGNVFSAKKVADYLKSQRMSIAVDTVQNYLSHLCSTYALHKVQRYDIKGKRLLEVHEKYYLGDLGLRHAILGFRENDIGGMLENIVFLELKRRGYIVHIGKFGDQEVDFIATKAKEKIYIQVTYLLASAETIEREFSSLIKIQDNYPKFVLSMDKFFGADRDGIKRENLISFLLKPSWSS